MSRYRVSLLAWVCAAALVALVACGGEGEKGAAPNAEPGAPNADTPVVSEPGEGVPEDLPSETPADEPEAAVPDATEPEASASAAMAAVVKAYYAAMAAGDLEAQLALCDEELAEQVEADLADRLGTYEREALAALYRESPRVAAYTILRVEPNAMSSSYGEVIVKRSHDDWDDEITFQVMKKRGTWLILEANSERRGSGMGTD